jgi:hypothetical protein
VGQDEDAQPLVRRADFCRAEQARCRCVAHVPKLSQHGLKTEGNLPGDVFNEHPCRAAFLDDAGDLWPQVSRIVGSAAFSGGAERLAGISGKDDIEGSSEGAGVEAAQVIPDWCRGKIPSALGGDEHSPWLLSSHSTKARVFGAVGKP